MWGARMMTDNEIIRALECCQGNADCANCPYYENNHYQCGNNFNKDVLDLINRQKAEIERLNKENNTFAKRFYKEGVKDFAKRLKDHYIKDKRYSRINAHTLICFLFDKIDSLERELVGDET